jgi:hypothetical protein
LLVRRKRRRMHLLVYRKKEKEWQLKVKLLAEIGLKRELHEEV